MSDELAGDGRFSDGLTGEGLRRNPIRACKPYGHPATAADITDKKRTCAVGWKSACGAKKRDGTPCRRPPLHGRTRCRLHGGATPAGIASPHFKHGRRSKYVGWLFRRP
jgi:hypothetical protein